MDKPLYEQRLEAALDALTQARDLLLSDIAAYPTPISGCDQQYFRLMSDRTRLAAALQSLRRRPFVATPRTLEDSAA